MNYTPVHLPAAPEHINHILPVQLTALDPSGTFCLGTCVDAVKDS